MKKLLLLALLPIFAAAQIPVTLQKNPANGSNPNQLTAASSPILVGNGQEIRVLSGGLINMLSGSTFTPAPGSNLVTTSGTYPDPSWITSLAYSKITGAPTGGTVSSVALTVPSGFSVSGSPVTSSGTLAVSFATGQAANSVLATPDNSTGALSIRALVPRDIPSLTLAKISDAGTAASHAATDFATPHTSAAGYGITNGSNLDSWAARTQPASDVFASGTAGKVLATPSGSSGVPAIRTLVASDIPSLTLSKISDASTLTLPFSQITSTPTSAAGYGIANGANLDVLATKTYPAGAVVGTTDSQTLTNKSIDAGQLTGTIAAGRLPSFTGDVTNSGAALTISAGSVGLSKMANLAAYSLIGNNTASALSPPIALTTAQAKALLAISLGDISGLGNSAPLDVGVVAGTVAAGDDPRFHLLFNTLGETIYAGTGGNPTILPPNNTTTRKFYAQTGNGTTSAAPGWVTVSPTDLPTPTPSTLGGVFSKAAVAHNFLTQVGTDGVISAAQPSAADLSNGTTGSGAVVLATSPTLTTPNIGSATGSVSGNAGTATALQTARTINGVNFDGTAPITITAAASNALTFGAHLTGTSYNGSAPVTIATDATSAAAPSTIVARDGSGSASVNVPAIGLTGTVLPPTLAATPTSIINSTSIVCYGDSLTEASYPSQLQTKTGYLVTNAGVGGQTSTQIAVRQGGVATYATVLGNTIPASGGVTVTFPSGYEPVTAAGPVGGTLGTISGVSGVVTVSSGVFTFTRSSSGVSVVLSGATLFAPTAPVTNLFKTQIIWAGRINYMAPTVVKSDIAAMVAALHQDRYLVLSVLNSDTPSEYSGGANYAIIIQLNADLSAIYGSHYADVRTYLVQNGLSVAGITPTAQDLIDISRDVVPSSLRIDAVHLTAAGYGVVASFVASKQTQWEGTPGKFVPEQYVANYFAAPTKIGWGAPNSGAFTDIVSNLVTIGTSGTTLTPSAMTVGAHGATHTETQLSLYSSSAGATRTINLTPDGEYWQFDKGLHPATDASFDIGYNLLHRWKNLYLSGSAVIPGGITVATGGTTLTPSAMTVGTHGATHTETQLSLYSSSAGATRTINLTPDGEYWQFDKGLYPNSDASFDIGYSLVKRWKNLYLSGSAVIPGGVTVATGGTTLTPSAMTVGTHGATHTETQLSLYSSSAGATRTINLTPDGSSWQFDKGIIPLTDASFDVGYSTSVRWKNLYLSGAVNTGAPSGGTAAAWKLGSFGSGAASGAPGYVEIDVAGAGYKTAVGTPKLPSTTVASLPSASTYGAFSMYGVTDALTPVIGSAVVGGGAVKVAVMSNGSTWSVFAILP